MEEVESLLHADAADRLVRTCRTTVGDSLRSVTYYSPAGFEQVYLRNDLEADADLAGFVDHESESFHARTAYRGSELGEYRYTIRVFDRGYLVSVVAADHGAFITMDGLTVSRSRDVASGIVEVLRETEPIDA